MNGPSKSPPLAKPAWSWLARALLLGVLLGLAGRLPAATPWETTAREVVQKLFEDGIHELAGREAQDFLRRYPGSEYTAEVALILAQCHLALHRPEEAAAVLLQYRAQAGPLEDEFLFWLGQARAEQRRWAEAAEAFAELTRRFPESDRRFEACYREAWARFEGGDLGGAINRLQAADGPLARLRQEQPESEWIVRCDLLLGEALWRKGDLQAARQQLENLRQRPMAAALAWQREFLLAHVRLALKQPEQALAHTTNFWTVATNLVAPQLLAEAAVLEARIHEQLDQPEAAARAYERNLAPNVPAEWREAALRRLVDLGLAAGQQDAVAARLEQFIREHPGDPLLPLARLTLGDLCFQAFQATRADGAGDTNLLAQARAQYQSLLEETPAHPLAARAALQLGWTEWYAQPPRLAEAANAFARASRALERGLAQVEARLKWADCQFRLGQWQGALTNYWLVATNYADLQGVATNLLTRALFQALEAGIHADNLASATEALSRLQQLAADQEETQRAVLLLGRAYEQRGEATAARALYLDFLRRYPDSTLATEARLGLIHTHELEHDETAAIRACEEWLAAYTNRTDLDTNLLAQVFFDRARLTLQSGRDEEGVRLLSRFTEQFADNPNVALAQYLLGEHFFRQGDYGKAELLFLDPVFERIRDERLRELPFRARLMAGKAAFARQSFRSARDHFDWLITNGPLYRADSPVPVPIAAEAYLLRGDTFLSEQDPTAPNPLYHFGEAITAYSKVIQLAPTNALAPLAWGRIGDCNLQLAATDPRRYQAAADAYRQVISSTAPIGLRSMAEVGLAIVYERQAATLPEAMRPEFYDQALEHYLQVFYAKNLREGELPEPYWVKQAGLSALELAEQLGRTELAIGLCQRLIQELPPLRSRLEQRLAALRDRARTNTPPVGDG